MTNGFRIVALIVLLASSVLVADTPANLRRENLVVWCIVPFDGKHRTPAERAEMLQRLGLKRVAYDWRANNVPEFEQEITEYQKHGLDYFAFWGTHDAAFAMFEKHGLHPQVWQTIYGQKGDTQDARVESAAKAMLPLVERTRKMGCKLGLYNHGGWGGEPINMIAVCRYLREHYDAAHVGIVYNLHHAHDHIDDFAAQFAAMKPYLLCMNLNGMIRDGDKRGRMILPIGAGEFDLKLLKVIVDSGYDGPIGIIGHTQDDVEQKLQDSLDGLDWLLPQLDGKPAGPAPKFRTWQPKPDASNANAAGGAPDATQMRGVVLDGDAAYRTPPITVDCRATLTSRNGYNVLVASDTKKSGAHWELFTMNGSGTLTAYLPGMKPDHVRSTAMVCDGKAHTLTMLYEPRRVRLLVDGKAVADQAVESLERPTVSGGLAVGRLVEGGIGCTGLIEWASVLRGVRDASTEPMIKPAADDATLLLWRADQPDKPVSNTAAPSDAPSKSPVGPTAATFPIDRTPLHPEQWSLTNEPINKNRLYDFYARQADYFRTQPRVPGAPELLAEYPGLDGGTFGHWGHESDKDWASDAWNRTDLGTLQSGVFRGGGVTVPRGVCVRLGDHGELSACFNPDTLTYDAVWSGGFVKYSPVRHGFMQGIRPDGEMKPRPSSKTPDLPFVYHGYYRFGKRIAFAYRLGDREVLDMPWAANGEFMRMLLPVVDGRVEDLLRRASAQWPQRITTPITLGAAKPYAVDHIGLPTDNPWRALLFCGGHAFLPDGSAVVCTMQGDVWRVTGFTHPSTTATWRRIASGLHHALGIVADNDGVFVLGRDQITRLHDLNGDGETDYYECFSNAYVTSPAGHDFICGLQRDKAGNFYIASGNQGVVRISPDGKHADVIATGFRNPDGLGITDDGTLTVPCSEGEWTPASMICAVPTRAASDAKVDTPVPHYGYRGPQRGQPPVLPLAYLPRGVDNSSGGQAYIDSDQWGPLKGQIVHTSFGFGTHFLVLRDTVDGQTQGAVVPLPGEFRSGVHRARFNPVDGQLYVSGMQGWVSFTPDDGCFARVRYTGDPVQLPVGFHVHRNGVSITFSAPLDRKVAADAASHFAQCWNYRYSSGYGSAEFSPRHPGTPGHDVLAIADAVVLDDGRTLFLHIPDLQPVNQLHLRVRAAAHVARDVFVTVHKLGEPFTAWPGYKPSDKVVTPHPIVADMARLTGGSTNPYRRAIEGARPVTIETGSNLTFATRSITVHAGEAIALTLANPDVVPHNWVLARPDSLQRVGDAADHYIAHPDAAANQYVPPSDDVIVHTDITPPNDRFTIYFHAPDTPGVYPYLCTFPGHWRVMNGTMTVEPR